MKRSAERFLREYDPAGIITLSDVYDEDDDLQLAIAMLAPWFEYPDWSHRTVRALWRQIEKEGGYADPGD